MSWNRPKEGIGDRGLGIGGRRDGWLKGLVAGVVVVLGSAVAAWLLWPDAKPPRSTSTSTSTSLIRETKPARAPAAEVVTNLPPGKRILQIIRSRGGRKNLTDADKAEIAALRKEQLEKAGIPVPPPAGTSAFECHSDQVISMVLTGGDDIPPFPGTEEDLEREFIRSLDIPIVINEDDSEQVKAAKRTVAEARVEIDAEMKKGRGFREILEEYRQRVMDDAAQRKEVKDMAREMMRNGEGESVDAFLDKANRILEDRGIEAVDRPKTREEVLEERRLRRLENSQGKGAR